MLEGLRDEHRRSINRKFARTIYPPVAQFTFAIALHAAYIASFFAVTDGLRLSTPVRNVAAGAMVLLALAAVPS